MFKKYTKLKLTALILAVMIAAIPSVVANASKGNLVTVASEKQTKDPTLVLIQGKGEIVEIEEEFSDILVANPSIIDVTAVQSNKLYIVGLALGGTNLVALDNIGNVVKRLNVHVQTDDVVLQELIDELFPDEDVTIKAVAEQMYLTGKVSNPAIANKIANIVGHYLAELRNSSDSVDRLVVNMLEVDGEQQVMLRVRIVEASRDIIKEFGIESRVNSYDANGNIANIGNGGKLAAALTANSRDGLNRDPLGVSNVIFSPGSDGLGFLDLLVNMLDDDDLLNVLAEPNLTAISGEEAGFLAGGEFPVPVGRDRDGNIVVEFREFGVSLNFKPTVMGENRISLQLETEVSSLSFDNAITLSNIQVPGLDIRRAETTVEMPSGGSLMIAGLLRSESVKGMTGIPGIKNAPILGDLLKSDSFQREETELVVIVTPYLVRPYKDNQQAKEVSVTSKNNPLAKSFADNIKRTFGKNVPKDLFSGDVFNIGYLLD